MWKAMADYWEMGIPDDELEKLIPVMEELYRELRPFLERDLSVRDPALTFRPHGRWNGPSDQD